MTTTATSASSLRRAVDQRRTVAIISHPDAGKTTLTEQLLHASGTIARAGAVRGKGGAAGTVTDWMTVERERGISVASSAVRIETGDHVVNLLDTPGHGDFSEDTYRVLAAVDAAVMLLDVAKGIEAQTRKLFQVCRARNLPIITFVNKLDRPGMDPLDVIEHVERELDLVACPVTWPAGWGDGFAGVVRAPGLDRIPVPWDVRGGDDADWSSAEEGATLAWEAAGGFDRDAFLDGSLTPVLFGSAVRGFGVRELIDVIVGDAPPPGDRVLATGALHPVESGFSAFVFKLQSNMDPRHRDVAAYLRVCSGRFERGAKVVNARSGRTVVISQAVEPFGRDRATVDEAWPGDVVVVPGAADLRIGDTLHAPGAPAAFPTIPSFAPDIFRELGNRDMSRRKQYQRGIEQLADEGVVQFYVDERVGMQRPICGAVGALQFEVFDFRMREEFGVEISLTPLPLSASVAYDVAAHGDPPKVMGMRLLKQARGDGALLAFESVWGLQRYRDEHPELGLTDVVRLG